MISLFVQKNRTSRTRKKLASKITTNKDFKDLKLHLTKSDQDNSVFMTQLWSAITERTLELLRWYSPKDTGRYSKAWTVLKSTKTKLIIGLPQDPDLMMIFRIKEFTGITVPFILPKSKKALTWIDPFTNERVFVKYVTVTSPLQKEPVPHLRPTMRMLRKDMPQIVAWAMKQSFKFVQRTMPNGMGNKRKGSGGFGGTGGKQLQNKTGRKRLYNRIHK